MQSTNCLKKVEECSVVPLQLIGSMALGAWVDNINMHLGEIGWDVMDWTDLVQDRDQWMALVNTELNLRVP
jgi:hypothetical protein